MARLYLSQNHQFFVNSRAGDSHKQVIAELKKYNPLAASDLSNLKLLRVRADYHDQVPDHAGEVKDAAARLFIEQP